MIAKIEQDHSRFKQIVRGKIKRELKKYITQTELIGRKGKNIVSIPVPRIELPRFRFDGRQQGGVGQGDGDVGTVLGTGDPKDGSGHAPYKNRGVHLPIDFGKAIHFSAGGSGMTLQHLPGLCR